MVKIPLIPVSQGGPIGARPRREGLYDTTQFFADVGKNHVLGDKFRMSLKSVWVKWEIECCGETHTIEWNPNTKSIMLSGHPEMADENALKALLALGNDAPVCLQIWNKRKVLQLNPDGSLTIPGGFSTDLT